MYSLGVTSNRLFSHGKWLILENLFSYANHTNIAYNASNQVWDKKLSFHTMKKLELLFKKIKTQIGLELFEKFSIDFFRYLNLIL